MKKSTEVISTRLLDRVAAILDRARNEIVHRVNSEIVAAYWHIGREISEAIQAGEPRARYGKKVLEQLSEKLRERYGKGYSVTNLKYFRSFYLAYPERLSQISHPAGDEFKDGSKGHPAGDLLKIGQGFHPDLSWSHYRALMRIENRKARQFYEKEAAVGAWSKRQLERQIHSMFYERILASKDKKGMLIEARQKTTQALDVVEVLKDPYVLEFLDLPNTDRIHESTLESAIIDNLQHFYWNSARGFPL